MGNLMFVFFLSFAQGDHEDQEEEDQGFPFNILLAPSVEESLVEGHVTNSGLGNRRCYSSSRNCPRF